jgi:hypothetical protein
VVTCSVAVLTDITDFGFIREPRKIELLSIPDPLRGCNSDLAQYSTPPSLRVVRSEDEDEDDDENEALGEDMWAFYLPDTCRRTTTDRMRSIKPIQARTCTPA